MGEKQRRKEGIKEMKKNELLLSVFNTSSSCTLYSNKKYRDNIIRLAYCKF